MTDEFETTIRNVFGAKGEAWLHELPALIAECEQRWQIQVQTPFKLSYNYVAPAVRSDGTQCVLKLGVLSPDLSYEIEAMQVYAGRGICRLIDVDVERGAQLLERLLPGMLLSTLVPHQDEQATLIAAEVMRELWRPAPAQHTLPTLAQWTVTGLTRLPSASACDRQAIPLSPEYTMALPSRRAKLPKPFPDAAALPFLKRGFVAQSPAHV